MSGHGSMHGRLYKWTGNSFPFKFWIISSHKSVNFAARILYFWISVALRSRNFHVHLQRRPCIDPCPRIFVTYYSSYSWGEDFCFIIRSIYYAVMPGEKNTIFQKKGNLKQTLCNILDFNFFKIQVRFKVQCFQR